MGLDAGFLSMLQAPFTLERHTGKDSWGNETYGTAEPHKGFIEAVTKRQAVGTQGKQVERNPVGDTTVLCDAIGVTLNDKITFGGVPHWVIEVDTQKDEFGNDLYQVATVVNQKKG